MVKFSVFYPNKEGKKFDMDDYLNRHIPIVQEKLGVAVKAGAVDQGLARADADSPATDVAMAHLPFDSVEQ